MTNDPANQARLELERLLDEALRDTFPASDPISIQRHGGVGSAESRVPDTAPPTRPKPIG
jgi:hypothetical protein